ncbi:hypothetical protein ABZ208_33885 [Streptomyces sp. NPDC006208]|uniref:hypothetical protein n=1 Tax=Streptomyces sp. NPDC006208 TaxID=3156734 RepID=UPI0033A166A2
MTYRTRYFISGWKLTPKQAENFVSRGSLRWEALWIPMRLWRGSSFPVASGEIDAREFESRFRDLFQNLRDISEEDFAVVNELFYVEDYVSDETARDPGAVTEAQLLEGTRLPHSVP